MKTLLTAATCVVAVFLMTNLSSCGGKDDKATCGATWAADLQNEVNAISTALNNYIADQSTANCNSLKTAYQNYLTKLRPYANCAALTASEKSQLNQAISQAEDDLETFCD